MYDSQTVRVVGLYKTRRLVPVAAGDEASRAADGVGKAGQQQQDAESDARAYPRAKGTLVAGHPSLLVEKRRTQQEENLQRTSAARP